MSSLTLFADAQGFMINGVFYPREFTISDGENHLNYEFDIDVNCSSRDQHSMTLNKRNVHGLSEKTDKWKATIPSSAFLAVLKGIYTRFSNDWTRKIAVNNNHLAEAMRNINIPVIDVYIPSNIPLEHACELHAFPIAKCSLAKVKRLYKYLKD